jgi:pyrroloquinoline quinone biosynthesis protein D
MDGLRPRLKRHFRFQWEPSQQAHVLLYPEGMIKLNASAGEILKVCDGERTTEEVISCLRSQFPEATTIAEDVAAFLDIAKERGWLELV